MEASAEFGCKYCGRCNFFTQEALNKHQRHGICAIKKNRAESHGTPTRSPMSLASDADDLGFCLDDDNQVYLPSIPSPPKKASVPFRQHQDIQEEEVEAIVEEIGGALEHAEYESSSDSSGFREKYREYALKVGLTATNSEDDEESSLSESKSGQSDADSRATDDENQVPDTTMRDQFREYCSKANKTFPPFTEHEVTTIKLLHTLKEKHTPMNAFEPIMFWHLTSSNRLRDHQSLRDYAGYIGRKKMMNTLLVRYNYENKMPFQKTVKLPVSGSVIKLTCHDALASIQRLLTDPRIKPQNYLFWDGNPLQPPPEDLDYIADLNTGQAYLQTYAKLITTEGQQLLPVVIYTDGTAVSHFHDMEIIQVKIALGIFTREARMKAHFWVPLGYIEKIHEQGGRGRSILEEANHMETQDAPDFDAPGSDSVQEIDGVGDKNDQDYHAMMAVILEDFVALQERGIIWDHHDQITGQRYEDIHYLPFVPFLRVDGKEADLCCAKYAQRSSAQHICRKCHIPLQEADDHLAKYPLKTVKEIKKLVEEADLDGLRALSQTYLKNAFYKVRFSQGNDRGIHGSCPSELLHAFLLGTFKYLRDIFFEMVGSSSENAKQLNALAKIYGKLFSRQSDRTMPGTAFSKGIMAGKLMAKDYRGVLLIILAIVRSSHGRTILKRKKVFRDAHETALDDWILLVELMLEWEAYLNEPRMQIKHVKRLEKKHRYIMYIMRRVAQRTKGMGLKLLKFHTILHIWEDIIECGVPLELDTSANEMHHKPSKFASTLTQRAADTFNFQTAKRLCEFDMLDLAMEEINNDRRMWDYYATYGPDSDEEDGSAGSSSPDISTGETQIRVYKDRKNRKCFEIMGRGVKHVSQWATDLVDFLWGLQELTSTWGPAQSLPIYTCHRRNGQIFRGHPNYRGKGPWRDWVWVDWGAGYGKLPSHIWCFVVIERCPSGRNRPEYGGIPLKNGTYAVVETTQLEDDEMEVGRSDLMMPVLKDVDLNTGQMVGRQFYLADVEAFADPCCIVPDIGGKENRYFVVKPRNQWSSLFVKWIEDEHYLDEMDPLDDVEEEDDED